MYIIVHCIYPLIINFESWRVYVKICYQRSSLVSYECHYWDTYTLYIYQSSQRCTSCQCVYTMPGMPVRSTLGELFSCTNYSLQTWETTPFHTCSPVCLSLFYLVPTSTSMATRSTYSKKPTSPELSSKFTHLESIKRNYRVWIMIYHC